MTGGPHRSEAAEAAGAAATASPSADVTTTNIASTIGPTDMSPNIAAAAPIAFDASARNRARGARMAAFVGPVMTGAVPSRGRPTGGPEAATAMLAGEEPSPTSRNPTTVSSGAAPRNGQSGSPVPLRIHCPGPVPTVAGQRRNSTGFPRSEELSCAPDTTPAPPRP